MQGQQNSTLKRDNIAHYNRRQADLKRLAGDYLFKATNYTELLAKIDEANRVDHHKVVELTEFRRLLIAIERRPNDSELRRDAIRILEGL
jgi:hypothetical protein